MLISFNKQDLVKGCFAVRKSELHPKLRATCIPVPDHSGTFAVVPLPAPHFIDVPSCHVLIAAARREMDVLTEVIAENSAHADLLFHMLNRREAVDSSQIEGTHTSFDGLLLHEIQGDEASVAANLDAEVTLDYVRAFSHGAQKVEEMGQMALNQVLIRELHAILMHSDSTAMPGHWRSIQNWVGTSRMETATYVPPPPGEIPRLMADLDNLLQYEPDGPAMISILIRAAIAHVQFEAVHPFRDGNGRTGRLLLPLMFKAEGEPPVHLATFLKVRKNEYYKALEQAQKRLDWAPWLKLFLECVIASCRHTVRLFAQLRGIQADWHQRLSTAGKRKDAAVWKVSELLLGQPVITANAIAQRLGVSFPAASTAIKELTALDILRQANSAARRHRVFHAHEILNALHTGMDEVLDEIERPMREISESFPRKPGR